MLCAHTIMMVLVCFLIRQRQYFAGSLSELSKWVIWPRRHAHDDPLALHEILDTRRGKSVFSSNAICHQFASRDQSPDRHRLNGQHFPAFFSPPHPSHPSPLTNHNKIYTTS